MRILFRGDCPIVRAPAAGRPFFPEHGRNARPRALGNSRETPPQNRRNNRRVNSYAMIGMRASALIPALILALAGLGLAGCRRVETGEETYPGGRLESAEHFTDGVRDGQAKYWDAAGGLAACYDARAGDCLHAAAPRDPNPGRMAEGP
jgi:hypothetical protein